MKLKTTLTDIKLFTLRHKTIINIGAAAIGVFQGIREKKYLESVRIAVDSIEKLGDVNNYPHAIFNEDTGWKPLFDEEEGKISELFIRSIQKYLTRVLKLYQEVHIFELQNGAEIIVYERGYYFDRETIMLYNYKIHNKDEIRKILIDELFATLNSHCIQISKEDNKVGVLPLTLKEYSSNMVNELQSYIQKAIDLNLPRAIMLCGEPGSGKSAAASTLLKRLNLQTLVIKEFNKIGYDTLMSAIKILKIEAILIDDLDHANIGDNALILKFLEQIRGNIKVVIATVNSTKEFNKALIRPGRFDKIILANRLDESVVKGLLGDDLLEFFDKVNQWPIAYVNEFVLSMQLENKEMATTIIEDLNKRASNNKLSLGLDDVIAKIDEKKDIAKSA